ncbi:hypothetical protein [Sphaerisporangium sp. NPDC051011]|uniref:hypothetical protein n=1 Tax=Sphaerisporangium sp. NPDC051011 TaxID=3155792 RepID=UPI0033CCD1DA
MAADDRLTDAATPGTAGPHTRASQAESREDMLARRLRDAYRRVAAARLPPDEKQRIARRFVAICDLAKRDVDHACTRLDDFLAALEAESDTPSSRNIAGCD